MTGTQNWKIGEQELIAGIDIKPHELVVPIDQEGVLRWTAFVQWDHPARAALAIGQAVEVTIARGASSLRWWAGKVVEIDTVVGGVIVTTEADGPSGLVIDEAKCNSATYDQACFIAAAEKLAADDDDAEGEPSEAVKITLDQIEDVIKGGGS